MSGTTSGLDASPEARIRRIRERYQSGDAWVSIERARYFTQEWDRLGDGIAPALRSAAAMKHVYENMNLYLDPDDRIAGALTEHFLGIPIDIERGVFNTVLATELRKRTLASARIKASLQGLRYMARKGKLRQFLRDRRLTAESGGASPLELGLKTLRERSVNPFQISASDERELLTRLLPRWKGKSLADRLEKATLESGVCSHEMIEFAMAIPGNTSRQVQMISTAATIATIQGHVILDFGHVLRTGLSGMAAEIGRRQAKPDVSPQQDEYLRAAGIALEGIIIFTRRLAERVALEARDAASDPQRKKILLAMAETCRRVPLHPAASFREAVQSIWTIKTAVEIGHPVNLHCFGRLDQDLYPYFRQDIDAGKITREEVVTLLEELLLKVMSQNIRPESNILGNFYHRFFGSSPITLAGVDQDGNDATNELTYLFVAAAEKSRAVTNVSVRVAPSTPPALMAAVGESLYRGSSNFSLFNDDTHIEAMTSRGFSLKDARDYAIMGCVEATCPGKTGSMSASAILLARILDITLRNGDARTLAGIIKGEGLIRKGDGGFESFEELVVSFLDQAKNFIAKLVRMSDLRDRLYADTLPAPLISLFMDGCLENAADVTQGGGRYDLMGISMINSIANVTDSLLVIQKLVFEQKSFSLKQIQAAVDSNYVGHEDVLREIEAVKGKWGNGAAESDALAARILQELSTETRKYQTWKKGAVVPYLISMTTHTIDGRLSIASPDGRRAATPFAASGNPYNVDKSGVTAVLRSVAALPHNEVLGCAVNVRFHPSAIGHSPAARRKWIDLMRTYFKLGGGQIQPTVASAEVLRSAQKAPKEYGDLIVKVGGYSTYFVDLGQEIQNEIIARTEHC